MKLKTPNPASKAKKTHFRRCFHCEKRFKNPQAVRGHQPHCPVRRLNAQAGGQTQDKPTRNSVLQEDSEYHRPGPDSKESKLLLVNTHEDIEQLIQVMGHIVAAAHFFFRGAFSHVKRNIPPEEWAKLHGDLDDVERDFQQMMGRLRLDQSLLFKIYHRLKRVRDIWLQFREHDYMESVQRRLAASVAGLNDSDAILPESRQMIEEDRARLDDVVTKVKHLLVAAR